MGTSTPQVLVPLEKGGWHASLAAAYIFQANSCRAIEEAEFDVSIW